MEVKSSVRIMTVVLGLGLSLSAQTVKTSASAAVSFRAEVAKVLRLESAAPITQQEGVAAQVMAIGPSTLRIAVRVSGDAPVLRLPVSITANVRSYLLQARSLSAPGAGSIGLADSARDLPGRQLLSRTLPLDHDPVFAVMSSPVPMAGTGAATVELRFDPVPSGETRLVTFELSLLESGS